MLTACIWARTDIFANFDVSIDEWLSWNNRGVTLHSIYDERWRDALPPEMQPEPNGLNLVARIKDEFLRYLAHHGALVFLQADRMEDVAYRAMAELVAARCAEDVDCGCDGPHVRFIVKPAGLDAAAKLSR